MKRVLSMALAGAAMALAGFSGAAEAQFYKGKRITILINYSAGGPTDIEGRLVAKHLSKHIPGNPRIIVKNVPGAGGITGSNYMGEVAKPDGLSLAIFTPPLISQVLQDPGLRVDFSKFVWLAGIGHPQVCYIRKDAGSGVSSVEDVLKIKGFKAAGMRTTSSHDLRFRMALDLLGADYKYVTGYKGLAKVVAGVMQNETQFSCGSVPGFRKNVEPNLIQPGHAISLWYYSAVDPKGMEVRNPHLKGIRPISTSTRSSRARRLPACATRPSSSSTTCRSACCAARSCRRARPTRRSRRCARRGRRSPRTRTSPRITPR